MVVDKYVVKSLIYKGFSVYQQEQENEKKSQDSSSWHVLLIL